MRDRDIADRYRAGVSLGSSETIDSNSRHTWVGLNRSDVLGQQIQVTRSERTAIGPTAEAESA